VHPQGACHLTFIQTSIVPHTALKLKVTKYSYGTFGIKVSLTSGNNAAFIFFPANVSFLPFYTVAFITFR
jgi:hypothetical protein